MEILGEVYDITIPKGYEGKLKIRTVDENGIIIDKTEFIVTVEGRLIQQ